MSAILDVLPPSQQRRISATAGPSLSSKILRFFEFSVAAPSPYSVVVLQAEVGDQLFAPQVAQCIFQLHELDEQIVFGI